MQPESELIPVSLLDNLVERLATCVGTSYDTHHE